MARLYANENFPLRVVEALRQLGHDVLTVHHAQAHQDLPPLSRVRERGRG